MHDSIVEVGMQALDERPMVGRERHGFQYLQSGRQRGPGLTKGCHRPYSALTPANLITFAHFSVASATIFPNSAGVPPVTVPPSSSIRPLILLSARPAFSSLFSISMMSAGVPLGTPMPAKPLAS